MLASTIAGSSTCSVSLASMAVESLVATIAFTVNAVYSCFAADTNTSFSSAVRIASASSALAFQLEVFYLYDVVLLDHFWSAWEEDEEEILG